MKINQSAGILLYRYRIDQLEFLLVHPGGPFHLHKDLGNWSIPKGEFDKNENALDAAKREFEEELGQKLEAKHLVELTPIKQKSGKRVFAWAAEGDVDAGSIKSNVIQIEFPARSGNWINVSEVDKAEWFPFETAKQKINPAQASLLDELVAILQD